MQAFLDGVRRVVDAPRLVAGIYLVSVVTIVPLGLMIDNAVESHPGDIGSTNLTRALQSSSIGFAPVLFNPSDLVDALPLQGTVTAAVIAYLVVWAFLVGGVLDRLASQRRVGVDGFLAACRVYFFRLCRLGILAVPVYVLLFTVVRTWLFNDLYELVTDGVTSERTALVVRGTFSLVFGVLVLAVNIIVDYAKIRSVVEDRRSMVGAGLTALRFARRRLRDVVRLYLLNTAVLVLVLASYTAVASVVGTAASLWAGVVVGQVYVVARVWTRLVFYASQTAYFQSQLAHAEYVAVRPTWRDSEAGGSLGPFAR